MTPPNVLIPRIVFCAAVAVLLMLGLVMVYSASSIVGLTEFDDDTYFFTKQLLFVLAGLVIVVILCKLPYGFWGEKTSWLFWLVVCGLLVLTLILGFVGLGAKRWLNLGFTFQPGELAKIAIMLVCVFLFKEFHEHGMSGSWAFRLSLAVGAPVLLIMMQPDLGTVIFAIAGTLVMAWLGDMPRKMFVIALVFMVVLASCAIFFSDFRQDRISSFFNPWSDPLGDGYQAINSFYAFADGGLFGTGLGNSHQKYYYLPEVQNDFIFAVIGEELGLIGALAVVVLFAAVVFSGFFIARSAPDVKGRMVAGTSSMLIGIQAFYNMTCVLGWAPITGKPLPFISAGGTSMLTSMILVGFILWVSLHSAERVNYERRRDGLVIHDGGRTQAAPAAGRAPAGAFLQGARAMAPRQAPGRAAAKGKGAAAPGMPALRPVGKAAPAAYAKGPGLRSGGAKGAGVKGVGANGAGLKGTGAKAPVRALAQGGSRPRPSQGGEVISLAAVRRNRSGRFAAVPASGGRTQGARRSGERR